MDDQIASLIVDYLEELCNLKGQLFNKKLYLKDCQNLLDLEHLRFRDLSLIYDPLSDHS